MNEPQDLDLKTEQSPSTHWNFSKEKYFHILPEQLTAKYFKTCLPVLVYCLCVCQGRE